MDDAAMTQLAVAHAAAEEANDLEATMATVADAPVWRFVPSGSIIQGRTAVEDYYRELLSRPGITDRHIEILGVFTNPSGAVLHTRTTGMVDAQPFSIEAVAVLAMDSGKIVSETVFGLPPDLPGPLRGPMPIGSP